MNKDIAQSIIDNLRLVNSSERLYETLLDIEGLLDRFGLYTYAHWFEGEVVEGPVVERHWVDIVLMYEYKQMPDPDGGLRLIKHGCIVTYEKSDRPVVVITDNPETTEQEKSDKRHSVEVKEKKVWLIRIRFPRLLLSELDDSMIAQRELEMDDIEEFIDNGEQQVEGDPDEEDEEDTDL